MDIIGGTAFIIGLAVGARGLGEAIFAIPTGHLINKIGNKKVMLGGMIGISISSFIAGLSQNNINIDVISTSEIKISVLINKGLTEKALNTLHDHFELGNTTN